MKIKGFLQSGLAAGSAARKATAHLNLRRVIEEFYQDGVLQQTLECGHIIPKRSTLMRFFKHCSECAEGERRLSVPADRKYHLRYALDSFLDLRRDGNRSLSGMVIEISDVGMSAIVPEELQKGERVTLNFDLLLGSITIDGIVQYSHKFRHGFRFTNMTEEQQRQLREASARLPVYCRDKVDY